MNIEHVLGHHLLDHSFGTLFVLGGIPMNLTKHLIMMWLVGLFLLASMSFAAHGQGRGALVLRTGVEVVVLYLRDEIVDPLLGHDGEKYLHYFLTLFFFILFCNLAGMLPLDPVLKLHGVGIAGTATGNIAVTAGLALCTLGFVIVGGVRAQGLLGFLKHFSPVPPGLNVFMAIPLGALLFVIEVLGLAVKIFALTIRLFANMIAGHIVILGFFALIFIIGRSGVFMTGPFALLMVTFVNFLELLVALLQAFIFTLLTAVFVGMVTQHH